MNYLVATKETQGRRKNDFFWCEEGAFVNFHSECGGEMIDGECGCRRSLSQIGGKGTTTIRVVEINDKQKDEIVSAIVKHLTDTWKFNAKTATKMAMDDFKELSRIAGAFTVGAILERRGEVFQERK